MRIAVVGAGLYGCTFARHLAMHIRDKIYVFEEHDEPGGLAHDMATKAKPNVIMGTYDLTTLCNANAKTRKFLRYFGPNIPLWWGTAFRSQMPVSDRIIIDQPFNAESEITILNIIKNYFTELRQHEHPDDMQFRYRERWIPKNGWTETCKKILDHPLITLNYSTKFTIEEHKNHFDLILYTGDIAKLFTEAKIELPYLYSLNIPITFKLDDPLTQTLPFVTVYNLVHTKQDEVTVLTTAIKTVNYSSIFEIYPHESYQMQYHLSLKPVEMYAGKYSLPWRPVINFDSKLAYAMVKSHAMKNNISLGGPIATWSRMTAAQTINEAIVHAEEWIEKIL